MAKGDRKALLTRPAYSEQAHRLAEELGRKAAANLRKSGYEVEQSSDGTWRVLSRPGSPR